MLTLSLRNSKHNVNWFNRIYFKSIPPSPSRLHTSKRENDLSFSFALFPFAICSQQAGLDKEASPSVRFFPYGRICSLATKQKWLKKKRKERNENSESITFYKPHNALLL